ncbi:protein artichoke-like [Battus philenor]|uniref:protein artichoke-like n=1 Tax=Battus philenor TaxID=42288 RepID=UPI0035D00C91
MTFVDTILPCICTSRHDDIQIWCTHSDLQQVLKGVQKIGQFVQKPIDELIIENNYLPALPGKIFQNVKIQRLMLRHNGLERVSTTWLDAQEMNLVEIFIVENELKSIPVESLAKLQKLQALTIQSDSLKRIPPFMNIPRLKYINIHSESLSGISENTFANLPKLERLYIQGSLNLRTLGENAFYNLPMLQKLEITECGVTNIHMRALSLLPVLMHLSLSNNEISDASMVGRSIRDLPMLTHLNLNYNIIDRLDEGAFVDQTMLETLSLAHNNINIIHHGAFHRVPKLREVDLNYNNVIRIHPESFLQQSSSGVEELNLIGNKIMHISEFRALLDALPRLKFLDMSDNLLQEIPRGALRGHPSLERLHLNSNSIKFIEGEAFMAMPALRELHLGKNSLGDMYEGPFWNLPSLKGLDLSNNFFQRIQPKLLYNLPSLRRLNLSYNKLTVIDPLSFIETPLLEYINISGNALVSIHPATFRNLPNLYELDASLNKLIEFVPGLPRGLEKLNLQKNQITNLPVSPSPDLDLPSLRTLDISNNGLQRIPYGSLKALHNLRRLYIRRNGLKQIDVTSFSDLTKLEILDLSYNQIFHVHLKSFSALGSLKQIIINGNNIENFDFMIFQDNNELSSLDFSKNKLKTVQFEKSDRKLNIEILNISSNNLYELPTNLNAFGQLKLFSLEVLDLSFNKLKKISKESFQYMEWLVELNLDNNQICHISGQPFDTMPRLKVLSLRYNNFMTNMSIILLMKLSWIPLMNMTTQLKIMKKHKTVQQIPPKHPPKI